MEKNWFNKDYSFFNYYEILENPNFYETLSHFFAINNIEESLHLKINSYLPRKKMTNGNFIFAIRNIILNYETKKENIIRKDFVTKALLEHVKSFKYKKYIWLDYDSFIK